MMVVMTMVMVEGVLARLRHEARKRRKGDEEHVQHRAGPQGTVPERMDQRGERRQQDEEHRRRQGENRDRTRRTASGVLG